MQVIALQNRKANNLIDLMKIIEPTLSYYLKRGSCMAKMAGSFSGVPLRTVQAWTEKGLVVPVLNTEGTGSKRWYNGVNCIEIGIVKALTKEGLGLDLIKEIMEYLRHKSDIENLHDDEVLKNFRIKTNLEALVDKYRSFLIIKIDDHPMSKDGLYQVRNLNIFGFNRNDLKIDGSDKSELYFKWWMVTDAKNFDKVFIINVSRIVEQVFKKFCDGLHLGGYKGLLKSRENAVLEKIRWI